MFAKRKVKVKLRRRKIKKRGVSGFGLREKKEVRNKMRIIRLYKRFKNQYRIHKHVLSFWAILMISWIQSKNKK
jgi:hypothetical protein